jgi:hypothetical protein
VAEACDCFMISPAHLPAGFDDFAAHVVPELQRRGCSVRAIPAQRCARTCRIERGRAARPCAGSRQRSHWRQGE